MITAANRSRRRRARGEARAEVARTLCAIVRCGPIAVAIPAEEITFIALAEDASVERRADKLRVTAGTLEAPAWLLAELLELEAPATSWLFVRSSAEPDGLIAIGCGECLTVQKLPDPEALPRGVFRSASSAIIGAFFVDEGLQQRGCGVAGIWVDPVRLVDARGET